MEVIEVGSVGIVELASSLNALFFVVLGVKAKRDLVVVGLVVPEVVEHILLPNFEAFDEFREVVAFLHFADEGFANAEDETALALIDHAHAVKKDILPVSKVYD